MILSSEITLMLQYSLRASTQVISLVSMAELLNQMSKALSEFEKLPKLILIVLGKEIIRETKLDDKEIASYVYGRMLKLADDKCS